MKNPELINPEFLKFVSSDFFDFITLVFAGLLSWSLNTAFMGWFSDYLGIKGLNFNFKQVIWGLDVDNNKNLSSKKTNDYILHKGNEGESSSYNSKDKGKGRDTSDSNDNSRVSGRTSRTELNDAQWEAQCRIIRHGLSALEKKDTFLSPHEVYAKTALSKINMYTEEQLKNILNEKKQVNLKLDPYAVKREFASVGKGHVRVNKESYRRSLLLTREGPEREATTREILKKEGVLEEFILTENQKSIVKDSLIKLKRITEHNKKYGTDIPANGFLPGQPDSKLTNVENNMLIYIIEKDNDASFHVKSRVFNGNIYGALNRDGTFIEYLERKSK